MELPRDVVGPFEEAYSKNGIHEFWIPAEVVNPYWLIERLVIQVTKARKKGYRWRLGEKSLEGLEILLSGHRH